MVVGMARAIYSTLSCGRCGAWRFLGILFFDLSLAVAPNGVRADDPPASPPALSAYCQAPASDIATPEPLPHLAAALESKRTVKVLAIGSSSTVGVGASTMSNGYPAQLEMILEKIFKGVQIDIINRGVSGEVAATTAERLKVEVALEHPDLVLWQLGTNDAFGESAGRRFCGNGEGHVAMAEGASGRHRSGWPSIHAAGCEG